MSPKLELVEMAVSTDGLMRWQLLRRADGFYLYNEAMSYAKGWDNDDGDHDPDATEHWVSRRRSGLFGTLDAALVDAMAEIPWLRSAR